MRRKTKNKKIIVVAIALLLLISVGYAAISTTLTINGTANIAATSWNVHFENVQVTSGSVPYVTTEPTILEGSTDTTSLTYNVLLRKPGEFYEFTVDVVNGGTINAKIAEDGITNTMTVGGSELTETQSKLVNYTVAYSNGDAIGTGDKLSKSGQTISGIGDTRTIRVRVEYKTDVSSAELNAVNEDMALTLTFGLNYVQD